MVSFTGKQVAMIGLAGLCLGISARGILTKNKSGDEDNFYKTVSSQVNQDSIKEYTNFLEKTQQHYIKNPLRRGFSFPSDNFVAELDKIIGELKGENYSIDSYKKAKFDYSRAIKKFEEDLD
jgi:hypothetical protein